MLNQDQLKIAQQALDYFMEMRGKTGDPLTDSEMAAAKRAYSELDQFIDGEAIASIWTLDDVHSANNECDIEQKSEDGEDDGLTWFHCNEHDLDTLDEWYCENHPRRLTDAQAKEVLQSVERNHDAEYGINWDSIRSAIDAVVEA